MAKRTPYRDTLTGGPSVRHEEESFLKKTQKTVVPTRKQAKIIGSMGSLGATAGYLNAELYTEEVLAEAAIDYLSSRAEFALETINDNPETVNQALTAFSELF